LMLATPEGQDPLISEKSFELGRNFANKLWNASRLVISNLDGLSIERELGDDGGNLDLADTWILSRLAKSIGQINNFLSSYRFNTAAKAAYDFVWKDYCDWYLEMIKPRLGADADEKTRSVARKVAGHVLLQILRLLQPFMPFVTEEIYHLLPGIKESDLLNDLGWPEPALKSINDKLEKDFELVQAAIGAIRNIRSEMDVPPGKRADVLIRTSDNKIAGILKEQEIQLVMLGKIQKLTVGHDVKKPPLSASGVIPFGEIYIPLSGLIDLESERARLEKELDNQTKYLDRIKKKLANSDFLSRAPADVIEAEKQKEKQAEDSIERLNRNLESLSGW